MADVFISRRDRTRINPAEQITLLAGPDLASVDTSSKTLSELNITLNDDLRRLTLVPASDGIYWADGTADTNSAPLPAGGVEIETTKDAASTLEFIVASGTIKMQVIQEGRA